MSLAIIPSKVYDGRMQKERTIYRTAETFNIYSKEKGCEDCAIDSNTEYAGFNSLVKAEQSAKKKSLNDGADYPIVVEKVDQFYKGAPSGFSWKDEEMGWEDYDGEPVIISQWWKGKNVGV